MYRFIQTIFLSLAIIATVVSTPPAAAQDTPTQILTPTISWRARGIYRMSVAAGHNPYLFTLAGDSNSNPSRYLGRISSGAFDLGIHPTLKPVVNRFTTSFNHFSIAVGGGFRAADMFNHSRAVGYEQCLPEEGLFPCELRISNASIVVILLGTGDKFVWRDFESNNRAMIAYAIHNNVLPILVTKADDIESLQGGASYGYINDVIRRLASEYDIPLLDLWKATRDLPSIPNPALPHRPFTQFGLADEWGYYFHLTDLGQDVHCLLTLQALAALTDY